MANTGASLSFKQRAALFFRNLSIRTKLLGGYTLAVLLAVLAGGAIIFVQVEHTVEAHIESELTNATAAILNMVKTAASTSIKNHLRAVAEKNLDIVEAFYQDFREGIYTENQAKTLCRKIMFSQTIGKTGYIFCANSKAIAAEHPNPGVRGKRFLEKSFVRKMIEMKTGYLEYNWKNPGEETLRPKAMYMVYFEPWDWIISASSYREEFNTLINVEDFRDSVLSLKFGKSGYAYINDSRGNLIVHPFISGNYFDARDSDGKYFVRRMCEMKTGKAVYSWKNPGESRPRKKLVIFNYIPEYDWIVSSASYLDEIYAPLDTIKTVVIAIVLLISILVALLSLWINASVVRPLRTLKERFDQGTSGDFSLRMDENSSDEIGQLAGYFNRFMDKLVVYSRDLREEIAQRKKRETDLKLTEEMFSKAFRFSPSGMFIASLKTRRIINVNDSFLKITRYSLLDLIGQEILTLSFFDTREEGRALFQEIENRYSVKNREICFLTRDREERTGLISGEQVNLWGEKCLLGAIEDVTESRRLEQEILDISQREGQQTAMALHDDLCPQLIGIEVMAKMLEKRLSSPQANPGKEARNTARIRQLISDAIEKARGLSRGLSPVNLTDRGFDTSLEDLAATVQSIFHIDCTLEQSQDPASGSHPPLEDTHQAVHAYYIVHEAVHNAVKHARCSDIRIRLDSSESRIRLSVTDDGTGLDRSRPHQGMGLRIMSFRAQRIRGELSFEKNPPGGTRVILELPRNDMKQKGTQKGNLP